MDNTPRIQLCRLIVLLLFPLFIQSLGPKANQTQPHPGNSANAIKKSADIVIGPGEVIKGRTQLVKHFYVRGGRRIDVQRPFDDDVTDDSREYEDDVREDSPTAEILGEVAGKERNKEEVFDNEKSYKSRKGDAEYELQEGQRLGKEMNKQKNKELSVQIMAPDAFDDKQQASDGSDERNTEGATRKTLQIYIAEEQADQQKQNDLNKKNVQKATNGTVKHNIKTRNNTGAATVVHNKTENGKNSTANLFYDSRSMNSRNNTAKIIREHAVFQEALVAHNRIRTMHHVQPLQWNATLASEAQQIADSVASDPSTFQGEPAGENIAQIWHDLPRAPLKAIGIWYGEKEQFSYSYPQLTDKVKHFTQMVWRSTNQLGMGASPSSSGKYVIVVALYRPIGNDVHHMRDNVYRAGEASDVYATIKERISRPNEDKQLNQKAS